MSKIVMPKNSADYDEILAVLKIYNDANGWVSNDKYKDELKQLIGDGQYPSSYTKKSQIPSYFGFTRWKDISSARSDRCITTLGKKFYKALLNHDKETVNELLIFSFENICFGRNNFGCPDSDSDVEAPNLFIRACLELGYLTNLEFAYMLWTIGVKDGNYTDTIREIRNKRVSDEDISLERDAEQYKDCKPILMMIRWGFLENDPAFTGQNKHIIISKEVLNKYRKRLANLKIYNVDKCGDDFNEIEGNVNNEQAFRDWMAQQKKDNGEPYSDRTIDQDCSELKNAKSKDLIKDFIPCENLFNIDYPQVIIDTKNKVLEDNEIFRRFNENNHNSLISGLRHYYDFLVWKHNRISFECKFSSNKPHNRIIFGAPGTGKSHRLDEEKNELLKDTKGSYERVTFHPDYSYAQFVGTYKPVSYIDKEDNKPKIKYEFVPGPFTRVLVKALRNCIQVQNGSEKVEPYLLIIEELNRAKTAAVFGDVFQLLDRKNGVSEYEIETSQDLRKYLANELGVSDDAVATIKIPDNMFIWATMNSADQGVFPLDTAFKRRWSFEYIDVDNAEEKNDIEFMGIKWNALRKAINDVLSGDDVKAHEDKLLGAFFIKFGDNQNDNDKVKVFCDKVLMYLFDDVVRSKRDKIFNIEKVNIYRFSTVIDGFQKEGINIFKQSVIEAYKKHCSTETGKKE